MEPREKARDVPSYVRLVEYVRVRTFDPNQFDRKIAMMCRCDVLLLVMVSMDCVLFLAYTPVVTNTLLFVKGKPSRVSKIRFRESRSSSAARIYFLASFFDDKNSFFY